MTDYIDRQAAIDALEREQSLVERPITETRWFDLGLRKAQDVLSELPSAEVEPVKHGRWEDDNRRPKSSRFVCSLCGEVAYYPQNHRRDKPRACGYPYCPNCGAKMAAKEGEEA